MSTRIATEPGQRRVERGGSGGGSAFGVPLTYLREENE